MCCDYKVRGDKIRCTHIQGQLHSARLQPEIDYVKKARAYALHTHTFHIYYLEFVKIVFDY